jgi:hypothetical protein
MKKTARNVMKTEDRHGCPVRYFVVLSKKACLVMPFHYRLRRGVTRTAVPRLVIGKDN